MSLTQERINEIILKSFDELQISIRPKDAIAACNLSISRIREEREERKGYECVHCGMIYPDHPVSACDCLEAGQKQSFHNVVISRVPPAAPDCKELVEVLEKISKEDTGEIGCYYTNRSNIFLAREALAKHKASMVEK